MEGKLTTMTYIRVIPRDLFNESNLLKCLGKLALLVENKAAPNLSYYYDHKPFNIVQNEASGGLQCLNVTFYTLKQDLILERPLNSRESWPLYVLTEQEDYPVFNSQGNLENSLLDFLKTQGK